MMHIYVISAISATILYKVLDKKENYLYQTHKYGYMQRKAQITSTVFLYIAAAVTVVLILFLGFKGMDTLKERGESTVLLKFKNKIVSDVESLGRGSVSIERYEVPSSFKDVCFVDLKSVDPANITDHPLIRDSVESSQKMNVFLFKSGKEFESFYVEDLQIMLDPYYHCMPIKSQFLELKFVGKGDKTELKIDS